MAVGAEATNLGEAPIRGGLGLFPLVLLLAAGAPTGARADFTLVDQAITNDKSVQATRFELTFSADPDFRSVDEFGRQANEFQYYVNNEALPPPVPEVPAPGLDVLIRGGEIARTGKMIVRLGEPGDGGPEAGGWGREIGQVPFALDGNKLRFTLPWAAFRETDGHFSYGLLLLEHGASADHRSGVVPPG